MSTASYTVQGRQVRMPCHVGNMSSYSALFLVPLGPAQELIAYSGLEPAEPWPGRALLYLAQIRYLENDLGPYVELAVAFMVRHADAPAAPRVARVGEVLRNDVGVFIHRLPVTGAFTCEAGRSIWGFPKFVADATMTDDGERMEASWSERGVPILRISMRTGGHQIRVRPRGFGMDAYSHRDGVTRRTVWNMSFERVGVRLLTGLELELGSHAMADELRAAGLPRRALLCMFGRAATAEFAAPQIVGQEEDRDTR